MCTHKGTYADDCLVQRVTEVRPRISSHMCAFQASDTRRDAFLDRLQHKCYIVATCDRDLKRRIRKIPGIPIMYVANHKYAIERLPDALGGIGTSCCLPRLLHCVPD